MSLQVEHINKWFGPFQAIKDLCVHCFVVAVTR
jgi:hypothetical protein